MNQFVVALQRFGIGRLVAILGIGIGVAAALVAVTMNLGQPKALLYSNLDLKEAGSITQALDQAGVKYEVKGDGSTILVPRDDVASTRLLLSGKGLPTAGSVGYEIFDNANALGQTDFVQQLNRQRALEGELARTIRSLDGVTAARVHLVLPKRQLFDEEAEQPSASVNIGVGGREPGADQVRAIQNLVASAVPNLKPDRVTVVDQHAKTLSGGETGMAAEADSRKSEVEQRIAKQVKG
ncbi:MAG: flagellar basal-body MS-ring/collar protein FliF, partial [Phenylobacterium sp.]